MSFDVLSSAGRQLWGLVTSLLFAASAFAAQPVAPIGAGNALTLPAQRHVVRLELPGGGAVWLLALQQEGQQGRGLGFFRSDDEGVTWRYEAPIQNDWSHPDRADLLPVGLDVALVYSYEGSTFMGSSRHDVYFQWWRYQPGSRRWTPSPAVRVFDSTQGTTGYGRAELARDSLGRLWVQAFRLEANGSHTAVIAVSGDGGLTFQPQPSLVTLSQRAARLMAGAAASIPRGHLPWGRSAPCHPAWGAWSYQGATSHHRGCSRAHNASEATSPLLSGCLAR